MSSVLPHQEQEYSACSPEQFEDVEAGERDLRMEEDVEAGERDLRMEEDDRDLNTAIHEVLEEPCDDKDNRRARRRSCYIKLCVGLLLAGFVIFVISDSLTNGHLKDGIDTFLKWIEDNTVAGVFLFMVGKLLGCVHTEVIPASYPPPSYQRVLLHSSSLFCCDHSFYSGRDFDTGCRIHLCFCI